MDESKKSTFGPITRALVRLWLRGRGDLTGTHLRAAFGTLEGAVSIVVNTLLFAVKLVLGLLSGSIALIADAVHTLSDSITSVIVIAGARVSRRPPDREHPFGHGRAEAIATVAIAVLLGIAGLEFGRASVNRIIHPMQVLAPWWGVAVLVVTMAFKEWLSRFAGALATASGNQAIEADRWHHRSDVFATGLVVVGMVAGRFGVVWLDGVMGIGVSLLLIKVGYDVLLGAVSSLLGEGPSAEELNEVRRRARAVDGVLGVHDVVIHRYGELRFVSLHVETSDHLTANELHELAERVEKRVATDGHGSVAVHVDPLNTDHPARPELLRLLEETIATHRMVASFHDLRVVGDGEVFNVVFDINLRPDCDDAGLAREQLERAIHRSFPAAGVAIEIDPLYSY